MPIFISNKIILSNLYTQYYNSPVGVLEISASDTALCCVMFRDAQTKPSPCQQETEINPVIQQTITQLDEYFAGTRKTFDIPISLQGTEFQNKVWEALNDIPFGSIVSYAEQAKRLQNPKAIRAIGSTNGLNKINIIIPCHRITGSNGKLTGYGGDLWVKAWLIDHEKKHTLQTEGQMKMF